MKTKLIIATDGEKTVALKDGKVIRCEELDFHAEFHSVALSVKNENLTQGAESEAFFFDFVEEKLGYKLRRE